MSVKSTKSTYVRLQRRARRAGVTLSRELAEQLEAYFRLLSHWNARMNLTSLDDRDEAIDRLLVEPLVAARHLGNSAISVLDVGSGAGSPAIPMKLASPRISLWMVEAKMRKSAFLREVIRELNLGEARVETSRYEQLLLRSDLHEAMNVVTLRALRIEARVLDRLQAFVAPGGRLFLFRGPSGPEVPATLTPPLAWQTTIPLIESLRSRLVVVEKGGIGRLMKSGATGERRS